MVRAALLFALVNGCLAADPTVTLYEDFNQALHVSKSSGTSQGGTIVSIGKFATTDACQKACIAYDKARCWSFVHTKPIAETYMIRTTSTNKTLQADDEDDHLISTRFQTTDDYSKFVMEQVDDAVRIRVLADNLMLHADDEGNDVVSTNSQGDDDYNHFYLVDRKDGTYNIKTKASGRYWSVKSDTQIVYTSLNKDDPAAIFTLQKNAVSKFGECFAVISPGFNPSYDVSATSGVVDWPCRHDEDCSLNGKCSTGTCLCRPAWKGKRCETLNLQPATKGAGYRGVDDGHNTSSWGGAILPGPDGKWHMYVYSLYCFDRH
jgi:hypothetical protein